MKINFSKKINSLNPNGIASSQPCDKALSTGFCLRKRKEKVIVIGGGFGGLQVAKGLASSKMDVLLLDKNSQHVFQPLLFQVASAVLDPKMIMTPIRDILRYPNAFVLKATVAAVDKAGKKVILSDGQKLSYDYLVIAPGSQHSYFNHPEWEARAPGLRTTRDALRIREIILKAFEEAKFSKTRKEAINCLRFIIVGGGPTGVELAGAIAELIFNMLKTIPFKINKKDVKIYLVDPNSQLLSSYPPDLAAVAHKSLEKLGVKVLLNNRVTEINHDRVRIENKKYIKTRNVIWAAGNQAPSFLKTLDTPLDKQGRVLVESDLTIPGHSELFVIGDAAHVLDKQGNALPGVAQVAMQEGAFVASIIRHETLKTKRHPFKYFDKGRIAIVSKRQAVLKIGSIHLSGFFAWIIWNIIHLWHLSDYRNSIRVLRRWVGC